MAAVPDNKAEKKEGDGNESSLRKKRKSATKMARMQ